ncbi:hypothetical protein [Nonomuraea sp. NPDC048916]|uniref:hypothetical protein n=1 Tax=Nonomuraea sp. NPDC048916 TaxID=3154232 RepID=UPI00340CCB2F
MATLTAGVGWFAAGPAAADHCTVQSSTLDMPATTTTFCDGVPRTQLHDITDQDGKRVAVVVTRTARRLGLTGLATAGSATTAADLAGDNGASRLSALPSGSRNPSGLRDVSTMTTTPDLPGLPAMPIAVPGTTTFGGLTAARRADIYPWPVDRLPSRVTSKTLATVPKAVDDTRLPRTDVPELNDVGGLLNGLDVSG